MTQAVKPTHEAAPTAERPLAGLRILSLAEQFPGPLATLLLADLGADVILVERPNGGDPSRRYAGFFEALNRNKRSVVLDLKDERGRAAFLRLVDTADVVLEGFRPGVMARLGFGADALAQRKPGLIFASISSFGQTGPLAQLAGHDLSIQAAAGLLDIAAGQETDYVLPMLPLADVVSGMIAAFGIVSAIVGRLRGAPVAPLDIAMADALAFCVAPAALPQINGTRPAPFPPLDPGYGVYRSADHRLFTLSIAGEDHMWRRLCTLVGLDDVAGLDEATRAGARDSIMPRLRAALAQRPMEWLDRAFREHSIAFGPVNDLADAPLDPALEARGLFFNQDGARRVRQPILFGGAAALPTRPAPALGAHTAEILHELGFDD